MNTKKLILNQWIVLILIAFSSPSVFAQIGDIEEGAKQYNLNCARCHNPRPPQEFNEREWSVITPHMREKAHMSGTEILALEKFIAQTLTAGKTEVPLTDEGLGGEQLVQQYGCMGCHQLNGSGGTIGPSLNGIVDNQGPDYVTKKIQDPLFNNKASTMPRYPLSERDIATIIDYISKASN